MSHAEGHTIAMSLPNYFPEGTSQAAIDSGMREVLRMKGEGKSWNEIYEYLNGTAFWAPDNKPKDLIALKNRLQYLKKNKVFSKDIMKLWENGGARVAKTAAKPLAKAKRKKPGKSKTVVEMLNAAHAADPTVFHNKANGRTPTNGHAKAAASSVLVTDAVATIDSLLALAGRGLITGVEALNILRRQVAGHGVSG